MPDSQEQDDSHDQLVEELLALPEPRQRADLLHHHDLLDPNGLDTLLDAADDLLGSDPGKARMLAEICRDLAGTAGAPAVVPRAEYILAQAVFVNGEYELAIRFAENAKERYATLGMHIEALRTDVGKMAALLETGRYHEALRLGRDTLEALAELDTDREEYISIAAPLHMNRGGCLEYMGSYDEALDAYYASEDAYRELRLEDRVNEVRSNRSLVLLGTGQTVEALKTFEEVAASFLGAGRMLSYLAMLINIGHAQLQLGKYSSSLESLETAGSIAESLVTRADEDRLTLIMADAYSALNLCSEALVLYRKAYSRLKDSGPSYERARACWGMGIALTALSEFSEAEAALDEALDIFELSGNRPLAARILLEKSLLFSIYGNERDALELSERTLDLLKDSHEWPVERFFAHLRVAELLGPDAGRSEVHFEKAGELLADLSIPHLRYRFNERLGRSRSLDGRHDEAAELYRRAIDDIELLRGAVSADTIRASFLQDKLSAYAGLMEISLSNCGPGDEDGVIESLRVAEQAKSRALAELLEGITSQVKVTPGDTGTSERLKVLQADLGAVYSRLLGGRIELELGDSPARALRDRAAELEAEISRLRLQPGLSETGHSDLFEAPATRESALDRLPSDVVMLAYHVLGDEILAFVLSGGEVSVERNVGSVSRVRELLRRLDSQWDRFRSGQGFSERQMAMLEKSTGRLLAALYDEVVRAVEPSLCRAIDGMGVEERRVPKVVIVPHGPLHQAPFPALFDGERYMLDRFEISYAPSASVFVLCQERESHTPDRVVAVGVSDELIPTARDEALAVARMFPESRVLLDAQATQDALTEAVGGCGVLHLACHGMFRSDNPMFSALKLHGEWLLAHDAMGLDLDGAVVVLSACESGRNVVVGGDEILGLTRAFLGARAATLLVSLWIVQDDTTPDLMHHFYGRLLDGSPPATALRAAQLRTKQTHPHPYYWAPFIAVGKR